MAGMRETEGHWSEQEPRKSPLASGLERNPELEASEKSEIHL